jgi:CheY-like chemotaxis protein
VRVLLVEDNSLLALMCSDWISELGHEVVGPVTSSRNALQVIENNDLDAAILDVDLGKGDSSYPVAEALQRRGVPFAFATGYHDPAVAHHFDEIPVLCKPFVFEDVEKLLAQLPG